MENNTILKSQYSEMEYCVFIVNDDVNNGDTIDFRTYETVTAPADSYTATGRVTVTKAASSNLTVDDAYVTTQVDPVSTTKSDTLVIADASIEPNADNVITTKSDTLVIADASVETQVDAPTITEIGGAVDLTVDDAYVTTQVDAVQTTKSDTLVVDDVYVETQTDNITITKSDTLSVADLYATTQMDSPTLIAPQGIIIEIHLEEDLSEFTSTVTDGGDLYWSADAALAGSSGGMACFIDDNTEIYGVNSFTEISSGIWRTRFYLDPNSIALENYRGVGLQQFRLSGRPIATIYIGNPGDGSHSIFSGVYDDNSVWQNTSWYAISDEEHYVEVLFESATGEDSNDGIITIWIDGVQKGQKTGLDLYTYGKIDTSRFGIMNPGSSNGTVYLDELIVNDDGSEIGPVGGSGTTLTVADACVTTQVDAVNTTKSDTLAIADSYVTTQIDESAVAEVEPSHTIIEIHLEEDLSEFTSTVTDGGDLYWSADAALAGTSGGMACLVDDTNAIYGEAVVTPANTSGVLRWRVYLDPNSLTMADGDVFYIAGLYNSSSNEICGFQLRYYTAGGYQVRGFVTNDSNTQTVVNVYITDAPHYIEMMVTRSDGGDNGAWSWWIDGDAQTGASNLDNDTFFANFSYIRIGAIDKLDTGTHDTFYLDELIVNDDGSEIGPVSGGNNLSVDNAYVTTQVDPVSTTKSDTLIVSDISVETQIDNVAVTKSDTISISDSSVDTQVDHVSTTKSDTLVVSNVYVETYVDAVEINSAQFLSVDDAYIETQVDQISISKSDTLVVANTYTDTQVDEVSITKSDTLVIADAYSTTQVDSLNLSGSTTLSVDNAYVTTQSDNVEVQKSSSLSVDNAYVETQTDNVTVTSSTTLSVNNTYVTTQVDGLSVTKSDTLIISDSYVTTQVDSFAVSSLSGLAIDNVYVIPALDNLVVVQHQTLVIDDAEHGNTTDGNLVFIQYQSLSIDETVHDNYTDGPILPVQHQTLVIADTEHGQESEDGLVFIQYQTLAIDDTEHANYTDGPVLIPKTLTIQEALHGHLVDYIVFDGYDVVGVQTSRKLYLGAYRRIRSFGNRM